MKMTVSHVVHMSLKTTYEFYGRRGAVGAQAPPLFIARGLSTPTFVTRIHINIVQVGSSPVSRAIGDLLEAIELYVYILLCMRMHIVKEFATARSLLHIMSPPPHF